jgi:hypothetical protein
LSSNFFNFLKKFLGWAVQRGISANGGNGDLGDIIKNLRVIGIRKGSAGLPLRPRKDPIEDKEDSVEK